MLDYKKHLSFQIFKQKEKGTNTYCISSSIGDENVYKLLRNPSVVFICSVLSSFLRSR
jgi:hypothetical protein